MSSSSLGESVCPRDELADVATDQQLHPQSFVFTSPLTGGQNYNRTAFEADLPAIEFATGCDTLTGSGCTNPPPGAAFYPLYTTTSNKNACAWREGGTHMPGTANTFGGTSTTEYGNLVQLFYPPFPGAPGTVGVFEDFRNVLSKSPCSSPRSCRSRSRPKRRWLPRSGSSH